MQKKQTNIPEVAFAATTKFGFEALRLHDIYAQQNQMQYKLDQPHRVAFNLVIYFIKGRGSHTIDFQEYEYEPGSLLFTSAGQVQSFDNNKNSDAYILLFTNDFLYKHTTLSDAKLISLLNNSGIYSPFISRKETQAIKIDGLVEEIFTEHSDAETYAKEEIFKLLLCTLFLKIERAIRQQNNKPTSKKDLITFRKFRETLDKNFSKTRNAKDYAELLNISYKHLNQLCRDSAGYTCKEYIDNHIVMEIKRQLAATDISVKELAFYFGFDDPNNLAKYFKKKAGYTPADFRKNLSQ